MGVHLTTARKARVNEEPHVTHSSPIELPDDCVTNARPVPLLHEAHATPRIAHH